MLKLDRKVEVVLVSPRNEKERRMTKIMKKLFLKFLVLTSFYMNFLVSIDSLKKFAGDYD